MISLIFRSSRRKPGPSPLGESRNGRDAPNLIRNHRRLAGQNWVPAFAGMSGLFGWLFILTAILLFLTAAPVAAQEPPPTPDRPLADAAQEAYSVRPSLAPIPCSDSSSPLQPERASSAVLHRTVRFCDQLMQRD